MQLSSALLVSAFQNSGAHTSNSSFIVFNYFILNIYFVSFSLSALDMCLKVKYS